MQSSLPDRYGSSTLVGTRPAQVVDDSTILAETRGVLIAGESRRRHQKKQAA